MKVLVLGAGLAAALVALHDAVSVCALFNFMNRLVQGLGIRAGDPYFALAAKRLHDNGYAGLLRLLP